MPAHASPRTADEGQPLATARSDDQADAPYLDAMRAYVASHAARLHVPGHKGGSGAPPALLELLGGRALEADVPQLIEGIDVGLGPTALDRSRALAADAWGARRSWFLTNGSTQGNHAVCLALASAGGRIVVQRNAHASTIAGLIAYGGSPVFVAPELDHELGIAHAVTPAAVERALADTPDACAVLVVSPTYYGAVADVAGLAAVAHARGLPLVVDEAWGSHLAFSERLPAHALAQGADVVVTSPHKTLGSLTGSALLHLGHDAAGLLDEEALHRALGLVSSTSPSSLLVASLDATRRHAALHGRELLHELLDALSVIRSALVEVPGLTVFDERAVGCPGVHGLDPLRLTIGVRATGLTGYEMARRLREADRIEVELEGHEVLVALFGMGEPAAEQGARLVEALWRVVDPPARPPGPSPHARWPAAGPLVLTPRAAHMGEQERVSIARAAGRVSSEILAPYPPGIPLVLPGERFTAPVIDRLLAAVRDGAPIRGASDPTLQHVRVVREQVREGA